MPDSIRITFPLQMAPEVSAPQRSRVLYYLGWRGQTLEPELERQLDFCADEVCRSSCPRLTWRLLPCAEGIPDGLPNRSDDLRTMLAPCGHAVLLAATLGLSVERRMMRAEAANMSDALIMDACAAALIEEICDRFEEDLRKELESQAFYLTDRFSPGYGDLPLDTQQQLCRLLQTEKRIGLTLTAGNILVPRKSVTAVMGIAETPQPLRKRGCETCSMFFSCAYRKNGENCHE